MKALADTRFLAVLAGIVLPAAAMLWLHDAGVQAVWGGLIFAVGLMAVAMITAAITGRFWAGVLLALLAGAGLMLLARALGLPPLPQPFSAALAMIIASLSFAARGTLFSRAIPGRGWMMAVVVVLCEAAMLATAAYLPAWLLVLLPAQWASTALQAALAGSGLWAVGSALAALGGTAAATLLVVGLWPRRWPYLLMFSAWLGLSALVWHRPGPAAPIITSALARVQTWIGIAALASSGIQTNERDIANSFGPQ